MLTQNNIIILLYSLPVYQLLFYTIQLISFKKSNPSRKYLGMLLLTMTLFLVVNAIYLLGYTGAIQHLYYIFIPLLLALPPLYFLYVNSLTNKNHLIQPYSRFILFIPPLFVLLLNLLTYGLASERSQSLFFAHDHTIFGSPISSAGTLLLILWVSLCIILVVQIIIAAFKLRSLLEKERQATIEQPSYLAHLQFKWVNIISVSLLVFVVAAALQILIAGPNGLFSSIFFNVIMLVAGGLAGYYGMKQDNLLMEVYAVGSPVAIPVEPEKTPSNAMPIIPPANREVPEDEANEITQKIDTIMLRDKPFLNKRFSIDDLSRMIDVRRSKVTLVINEVLGKNFHGLTNDYRVKEAIRIMEIDKDNLTIDAIADSVGFHSRSSFYACFKKFTGQTPKEYISTQKNNGS